MITIIKEEQVREFGEAWGISTHGPAYDWHTSDGRVFWASEAMVMMTGQEILVFEYVDGEIDWSEVAGGRGISFEEAKADLLRYLNDT